MDFTSKQLLKMIGVFILVISVVIVIKNNTIENIATDDIYNNSQVTVIPMNNYDDFQFDEDIIINENIDDNIVSYNASFSEENLYNISVNALPELFIPKIAASSVVSATTPIETEITTQKTYIVSRAAKKYDKNSIYIDIRTILQLPELPVGCEATSLTMVLNYYGFKAEKTDVAMNYLPQSKYYLEKDGKVYINNYNNFFFGDPFGKGYGCYSKCIVNTANKYISANGGGYKAKNISDSSISDLLSYVAKGTPVICWGTVNMEEPFYTQKFYDIKTDEDITWTAREHCFVLVGFNLKDRTVTINDPLAGIVTHDLDLFATRYSQLQKNAVIIEKNDKKAKTAATTESLTSKTKKQTTLVTDVDADTTTTKKKSTATSAADDTAASKSTVKSSTVKTTAQVTSAP